MVLLGTGVLACGLVFSAGSARANSDDCQERTVHADHKLHEAIEQHGYDSKQAAHWRQELHEAREKCWNEYHKWWDPDQRRWHDQQDWDEHDHDHYH